MMMIIIIIIIIIIIATLSFLPGASRLTSPEGKVTTLWNQQYKPTELFLTINWTS